jgi:hypothetical protein
MGKIPRAYALMTSIGSSGSGAFLNIYVIKSLLFERVIRPGRNVYDVIIPQGADMPSY